MHFSIIFAATCATFAAAAPFQFPGTFAVTNFIFGCSSGCSYSFDVAVEGQGKNHPEAKDPVHCSGGLNENKDYVECGHVSETQKLYAYIEKDTNKLKLKYRVSQPENQAKYHYMGEETVYAATSEHADEQKKSFSVRETSGYGVA